MKYNNINCIIFAKDKINREPAEFSLQRSTEGKKTKADHQKPFFTGFKFTFIQKVFTVSNQLLTKHLSYSFVLWAYDQ